MTEDQKRRIAEHIKASGLDITASYYGDRIDIRDGFGTRVSVTTENAAYNAIYNIRLRASKK